MSLKKEKKRRGYPFTTKSPIKEKDKTEEAETVKPKSPPRYGVYLRK